jgi:DNA-binding NtrC family response regulator
MSSDSGLDQPVKAEAGEAPPARVLVADDEESMRYFLGRSLKRQGFEVETVAGGDQAIERFEARRFDLAVVDLKMPGADGIEVLARMRKADPEALVILMTAYGTIRSAVEAMRKGAFDYITKPFEMDELLLLIERALKLRATERENRALRQIVERRKAYGGLIGQSAAMRKVFQTIDMLCGSNATVLISGESGTGKELLARAIHMHSLRNEGAFVALNCGAIPETLVESELFGHEAGAFTGAEKRKHGLVERAHGGTLFLDEISEMPMATQVKLLRFLQEKEITPVGSTRTLAVDLRVIAATNRDLEERVAGKKFRQDLYWRLKVVPVHLPPLRERREDIPVLVAHFLERFRSVEGCRVEGFTLDAMIMLCNHSWPGNVRELENIVERIVVLCSKQTTIDVEDLPDTIREQAGPAELRPGGEGVVPFQEASGVFEREYLRNLFKRTRGNISQAARLSGISRSHLHQKIKQLGIDPSRYR